MHTIEQMAIINPRYIIMRLFRMLALYRKCCKWAIWKSQAPSYPVPYNVHWEADLAIVWVRDIAIILLSSTGITEAGIILLKLQEGNKTYWTMFLRNLVQFTVAFTNVKGEWSFKLMEHYAVMQGLGLCIMGKYALEDVFL